MDEHNEQIALVCTKSLINIAKDLESINMPVMSGLCLFIAKTLSDRGDPQAKAVHTHETGGQRVHETVKAEIQEAIRQVKDDEMDKI